MTCFVSTVASTARASRTSDRVTDRALLPAYELARLLRDRELSARELLDHFVARIERLNPALNAVVTLDVEAARVDAKRLDDAIMTDGPVGPLHGLPITVKDALETAGMRTTSGARELADHVPERDADAVALVKAAGAFVFGKTNLPAFADDHQTHNELFGTSNNPWDTSVTPGGSSGGAAAAVAAGLASFEIGSDIANSIRSPASHCGVYGHKPTYGIVSFRGHIPPAPGALSAPDIAVVGPIARSADDLDLLLGVMAGSRREAWNLELPPPRASSLRDYRLAVWLDSEHHPTAPEVLEVLEPAVDDLERAGARIDRTARPLFKMTEARRLFSALLVAALSPGLSEGELGSARAHRDDEGALGRWARNVTLTHREWLLLDEKRREIRARWEEFFNDFDAVLTPCNPLPPYPHDRSDGFDPERMITVGGRRYRYYDQSVWAGLGGLVHLPSTAAPAGRTKGDLPVGFQIIGPYLGDRTCIDIAGCLADVLGGFEAPPMAIV